MPRATTRSCRWGFHAHTYHEHRDLCTTSEGFRSRPSDTLPRLVIVLPVLFLSLPPRFPAPEPLSLSPRVPRVVENRSSRTRCRPSRPVGPPPPQACSRLRPTSSCRYASAGCIVTSSFQSARSCTPVVVGGGGGGGEGGREPRYVSALPCHICPILIYSSCLLPAPSPPLLLPWDTIQISQRVDRLLQLGGKSATPTKQRSQPASPAL